MGEDLLGVAGFLNFPALQYNDPVGNLSNDGQIVTDVDTGHSALLHHGFKGPQDLNLGGDIKSRGGFIKDHQFGPANQRHRGRQALQLAARDLVRIAVANVFGVRQCQGTE